jgi:hypothetical protein
VVKVVGLAVVCLCVARAGWAQPTAGSIAGVVRDTTGAVLPGVTVEVASPALIEKVRTTVTDEQGRYNVVDLRPGTYSVTFSLTGFRTVRRDGIEISVGFAAAVNADLSVGSVEETVIVTGASPIVDVQNARTQQVMKLEVLEALPSGARDLTQFASLTLGVTASTQGRNDVGGDKAESNTGLSIHGGRGDDGRINYDGMNTNNFYGGAGGQQRVWKFNTIAVQETVVDTGSSSAEVETGGANVNMIPRDGGNRFTGNSILTFTNDDLASGKVSDTLLARGSRDDQKSLLKAWDYGLGVGGPIAQDRLWFYAATRFWGAHNPGANNFFNKSPVFYRYEADLSRPAFSDFWQKDAQVRFTLQAAKHKISSSIAWQRACGCRLAIGLGAPSSPEATTDFQYGEGDGMQLSQTTWTYPATNKLLFQGTASFLIQDVQFTNFKVPGPNDIAITEQTTGYTWGALPGPTAAPLQGGSYDAPHNGNNLGQRFVVSYVTGRHTFKTGLQTLQGNYDTVGNSLPNGTNYIFRLGAPAFIRQFATPFVNNVRVRSLGLFVQDQWTIDKLTLNLGLRFDHFNAFARAITVPAGPFIGERSYPELRDIPNFKDLSPRVGGAYDLFGNGKTAIKASFGRYLMGMGGGDAQTVSPAQSVVPSALRPWSDANGNFIPDCDLRTLTANGECGQVDNLGLGGSRSIISWAEGARTGWGVREYNYQTSVAVQHELRPGFGVTVGYYRTDWRNQQAFINRAVTPANFTRYSTTAPTDPRLGEVSGQTVGGLYDINPAQLGRFDMQRVRYQDLEGRNGQPKEVYNGIDIALQARFLDGGVLMGGLGLGRTTFDYCWQNNLPNVYQIGTPGASTINTVGSLPRTDGFCEIQSTLWDGVGSQVKLQAIYPLPYQIVISGTFKHLPGIPIPANYVATNGQVRDGLGRNLAACGALTTATCATTTIALLPTANNQGNTSSVLLDERINQLDLRLTKGVRVGGLRVQGIVELYNVLNIRPAQGLVATFGPAWQFPFAMLGGRLLKFGAQIGFD